MAQEIELKLTIAPADVASFRRSVTLKSAARGKPLTRTLHSIYFDTPERELAARGMALRLRKSGRQWLQTFKSGGGSDSGLHQRSEFETTVRGAALDFAVLVDTPGAELLGDAAFRDRLVPVFETRFRRTAWLVEIHPGETAELALDQGAVTAGNAAVPISEIEIELLQGNAAHLFGFAQRLLEEVPLRIANISKAERGHALLAPVPDAPARSEPLALEPELPALDACRAIVANCVRQLQANEHGVGRSDDSEYIHQTRVAIRRLRSAFGLFKAAAPHVVTPVRANAWRALGNALGAARDWDVLLGETLAAADAAMPKEPGLAAVRALAGERQAEAHRRAGDAVAAREYTAMLLDLAAALLAPGDAEAAAIPVAAFAAAAFSRRHRRVRKLGRGLDRTDVTALHALRIEIKKLRYAIEFFQSLYPRQAVKAYLRGAAELQALLGTLNDAAVTSALMRDLDATDAALSHGTGILRGWVEGRADFGLAHFEVAWKRFRKTKPFW